ncbi:MAG: metal-dependent hydrolase [Planctomycetota bacterium]
MDTITQGLLGAAIGQAGFRHRLGGRAVVFGAILGVAPDLDMVARFAGPWASLRWHRGPTHALFWIALATPLVGWLGWRAWRRAGPLRDWILLAFLALATHPLLDVCTSWGTQIFLPFSTRRAAIDAIAIIDPVYSAPLLGAVVLAATRWGTGRRARWVATGVLACTTLYLAFGRGMSQRMTAAGRARLEADGIRVERIRAMPMLFGLNQAWLVAARDATGDVHVATGNIYRPDRLAFRRHGTPEDPLVQEALTSEPGRTFRWFADGFVTARIERRADGTADVVLEDRRYALASNPARALFRARARFDADGQLLGMDRGQARREAGFADEVRAVWADLLGD